VHLQHSRRTLLPPPRLSFRCTQGLEHPWDHGHGHGDHDDHEHDEHDEGDEGH
jgi:hypothetical protein